MATLIPQGKQSYTNGAGAPLAGGLLYTYAAGTSTPLATYSDQAGTVPNANPVVLDARGEATIFWGAGPYKAALHDASDVPIWTQDDIYPPATAADLSSTTTDLTTVTNRLDGAVGTTVGAGLVLATGSTTARSLAARFADVVNVKDYGAAGDGVTDDAATIQAAIDAAEAASGGVVLLPLGRYVIGAGLTVANGSVILRGSGLGSVLAPSVAMVAVTVNPGASNYYNTGVENLAIDLNNVSGTSGVYLQSGGQGAFVRDVNIDNLGDAAYGVKTNDHNNINNPVLYRVRVRADGATSGNGFEINADKATLIACDATLGTTSNKGTGSGFLLSNGTGITMIGCEGAGAANGIYAPATAGGPLGLTVMGGRVEDMSAYGAYVTGYDGGANITRAISISGTYFSKCVQPVYLRRINGASVRNCTFKDATNEPFEIGSSVFGLQLSGNSVMGTTPTTDGWFQSIDTNNSFGVTVQDTNGITLSNGRVIPAAKALTYAASVAIDARLGEVFSVTVSNNTAFAFAAPTNAVTNQRITIAVKATAVPNAADPFTDPVWKKAAWTQPTNGYTRSISFRYDGTNWRQEGTESPDIPN